MATTQLRTFGAFSGQPYGSFSGKTEAVIPVGTETDRSFVMQPSAAQPHSRTSSNLQPWGHPSFFQRVQWTVR